ncbi:hypothetical protein F4604DRAFT_1884010 [Suillus subluteus]|nr:hypothetical protein F4604DRAFT_1884010 [Suillus subluteus]
MTHEAVEMVRAFAQGRMTVTDREPFTPFGLMLIQNFAQRGAHIIPLSPKPVQGLNILINLLLSTTKNDQIYADECDLTSPSSVRSFCSRFLTAKETRLDDIIFTHEQNASLASFLILTILPVLLFVPTERHIHQHALPSGGQIPKTDNSIIYVVSGKVQKSNIVAISMCPGLSRSDTTAPLLNAVQGRDQSTFGIVLYILQPFLRLLNEFTTSAVQSGGALYRECAAVNLRIRNPATADATDTQVPDDGELEGVHLGQAVWEGLGECVEGVGESNPARR